DQLAKQSGLDLDPERMTSVGIENDVLSSVVARPLLQMLRKPMDKVYLLSVWQPGFGIGACQEQQRLHDLLQVLGLVMDYRQYTLVLLGRPVAPQGNFNLPEDGGRGRGQWVSRIPREPPLSFE